MPRTESKLKPGKPTPKQLRYLRYLAHRTGTSFTNPHSFNEADREINRLLAVKAEDHADVDREEREVGYDMATGRGDAAQIQAFELAGYGAAATWADPYTDEPRVVHCKRERYDEYVGRPSPWGNPFREGRDGTREQVIAKYEQWIATQPQLLARLPELQGKVLGCWCAPKPCHADVLLRLANESKEARR